MLPSLKKIGERQFSASQGRVYQPPKDMTINHDRRQSHDSTRVGKTKAGGGFRLHQQYEEKDRNEYSKPIEQHSKTVNYANSLQKRSSEDVGRELKLIEKKIKQCQRKIEDDKRRKLQDERRAHQNPYQQDFQQIIRRQLEMQGYRGMDDQKRFDYLTNPGGPPQQQPEQEEEPLPPPAVEQLPPDYNINDNIQKLQRFYENSLKKKFERREVFPHKQCKRKTPKLYITHKTNQLNKVGKPMTDQEHRFRVMTKETTPQQIYPVIPNFAVVKDNLSKNIVSYLGDYKPFLDKTKEKVEKEMKKEEEKEGKEDEMAVDGVNKSVPVAS